MRADVYPQFFQIEDEHWWFRGMRALQWQFLRSRGLPAGRVLDVGCGTGRWMEELQPVGIIDGCDMSADALRFCQERDLPRLAQASATALPYRDGSYDVVTALGLIEHIADDERMLAEAYRVLSPGGTLLLLTSGHPSLWSEHDDAVHHERRYTRPQLRRRLEAAGFTVDRLTHVNMVFTPAAVGVRAVRAILPKRDTPPSGSPDLFGVPSLINRLLYLGLRAEGQLLRAVDLPVGLGMLALAHRPASGTALSGGVNTVA